MNDDVINRVFIEGFHMTLKGLELNGNARNFLEICEESNIEIESDNGIDWRDLPEEEIIKLAQHLASIVRKYIIFN